MLNKQNILAIFFPLYSQFSLLMKCIDAPQTCLLFCLVCLPMHKDPNFIDLQALYTLGFKMCGSQMNIAKYKCNRSNTDCDPEPQSSCVWDTFDHVFCRVNNNVS